MNRKNTILIAVLINAGLLSVLLIAALTSQEEVVPSSALMGDATAHYTKIEENPLFGDSLDLAMRKSSDPSPIAIPIPELNKPMEMKDPSSTMAALPETKEDPIVHKLPSALPDPVAIAAPAPIPTPILQAPQPLASSFMEVTVKKGDNMEKIAKHHHTTVDEILKLNQLPSTFLKVGQVLKIPSDRAVASVNKAKPAAADAKPVASPEYYTVKVGDNPWTIAMKHHMKIEELLRLNGLNEEKARKLKPGDRLRTR